MNCTIIIYPGHIDTWELILSINRLVFSVFQEYVGHEIIIFGGH